MLSASRPRFDLPFQAAICTEMNIHGHKECRGKIPQEVPSINWNIVAAVVIIAYVHQESCNLVSACCNIRNTRKHAETQETGKHSNYDLFAGKHRCPVADRYLLLM